MMIRNALIFTLAFAWTAIPSLGRLLVRRGVIASTRGGASCHNKLWPPILPRGGEIQYPTSAEQLDTLLQNAGDKLVVLYFCSSDCEKVTSLYQELSQRDEFTAVVHFVQIADHADELADKYQVTSRPTFLFMKQGTVLTEMVGQNVAEATLGDWIELFVMSSSHKRTDEGDDDNNNKQDGDDNIV